MAHCLFRQSNAIAIVTTVLALFFGLGVSPVAYADEGVTTQSKQKRIFLTVDVAEDFAKFVPGPPFDSDGVPQRGSFFVTEGKIYTKGTIQGDGASFDPNSEGSIGTWFCRGTHLVSGLEFPEARFAVDTAQAYLLPNDKQMIVTDGLEGGLGFELQRVVSGGTGKYRKVIGIQKQELIGFNASTGVNLRVTFELERLHR
jgi:hypothetical protein